MKFLRLLKGKTFIFVFTKYSTLVLQFVKTIFLAATLGPYYYGIWGFIVLVQQYLLYTDLGVSYSLNVLLSTENKENEIIQRKIFSTSMLVVLLVSALIILIANIISFSEITLFQKFEFNNYILLVSIVASLSIINKVFINLYRTYGKLNKISIYQFLVPVSIIPFLFIYRGSALIIALLYTMVGINLFAVVMFSINAPLKILFSINNEYIAIVIKRGVLLLIYNASFYFIIISSKTIVSKFFSVELLGQFTFVASIASASFLGLQAISWMVFPKALNRLRAETSNGDAITLINYLRKLYMPMLYLIIFGIISISPIIKFLLPEYGISVPLLILLLLSQGVLFSAYGYGILNIARNREFQLSIYGFIVISINIFLSLMSVLVFKLGLEFVVISLFISAIFYPVLQINLANKILGKKSSVSSILAEVFPYSFILPMLYIMLVFLLNLDVQFYFLSVIFFILLNFKKLIAVYKNALLLFTKPDIIDI